VTASSVRSDASSGLDPRVIYQHIPYQAIFLPTYSFRRSPPSSTLRGRCTRRRMPWRSSAGGRTTPLEESEEVSRP
jgi:hypothetical protein